MALLETLSPELQSAMGQHAHAQGERFDQLGVQLKSSQDILMQGQSELMQELQQVQASIQEHSMAAIKV